LAGDGGEYNRISNGFVRNVYGHSKLTEISGLCSGHL